MLKMNWSSDTNLCNKEKILSFPESDHKTKRKSRKTNIKKPPPEDFTLEDEEMNNGMENDSSLEDEDINNAMANNSTLEDEAINNAMGKDYTPEEEDIMPWEREDVSNETSNNDEAQSHEEERGQDPEDARFVQQILTNNPPMEGVFPQPYGKV